MDPYLGGNRTVGQGTHIEADPCEDSAWAIVLTGWELVVHSVALGYVAVEVLNVVSLEIVEDTVGFVAGMNRHCHYDSVVV